MCDSPDLAVKEFLVSEIFCRSDVHRGRALRHNACSPLLLQEYVMLKSFALAILCVAAVGCGDAGPTRVTANRPDLPDAQLTTTSSKDPANTGVNVRDRDGSLKTSFDQKENSADIKITADIRKRVVDTEMSTYAHNVKIITQDGKVTLRGPVQNADEKQQIEKIAMEIAGGNMVDSQLEIQAQ